MSSLPHKTKQLLHDTISDLDQRIEKFQTKHRVKIEKRVQSRILTKFIESVFEEFPVLKDYEEVVDIVLQELIFDVPIGSTPRLYDDSLGVKIIKGRELISSLQKGRGRVIEEEMKDSVVVILNKSASIKSIKQIIDSGELEDVLLELADGRDVIELKRLRPNAERDRILYAEHKAGRITSHGFVRKTNGIRDKQILSDKVRNLIKDMDPDAIEKAIQRARKRKK